MILLATLLIHFIQLAVLACVTVIMFSDFSCRDWSLTFVLFLQPLREKAKKKGKETFIPHPAMSCLSPCVWPPLSRLSFNIVSWSSSMSLFEMIIFTRKTRGSIHGNASTFGCLLKTTQHDSGWGYSYGWEQEQTIETRFVVDCKTLLQKGPHTDMNTSMP